MSINSDSEKAEEFVNHDRLRSVNGVDAYTEKLIREILEPGDCGYANNLLAEVCPAGSSER
jgi:hypothetical protein